MTFNRINDHTVRCILHENEIDQMGYALSEVFQQQDKAESFLRDIITRAKEAGFSMLEEYQTIQSIFLPNHQIVLNITDMNVAKPIDDMIENYLNAYEAVSMIGKERLTEIMNMKGIEKIQAFHECMSEIQNNMEGFEDIKEMDTQKEEADISDEVIQEKIITETYQVLFRNLGDVELFSKQMVKSVPSKLYKDKKRYCMVIDMNRMEPDEIRKILFIASDFSEDMKEDNIYSAYLEERADVIIKENAIEVLKNL